MDNEATLFLEEEFKKATKMSKRPSAIEIVSSWLSIYTALNSLKGGCDGDDIVGGRTLRQTHKNWDKALNTIIDNLGGTIGIAVAEMNADKEGGGAGDGKALSSRETRRFVEGSGKEPKDTSLKFYAVF